ncbi:MAG: DUF1761 domain-containing protein, partial [Candidatus Doudnabacteria bacterium]|nr:DUF1761 domain-containing protein [Candidatus Doudnabacteria bacterium]
EDGGKHGKKFPMAGAEFKAKVDQRVAKARQHMESRVTNLPADKQKEMMKNMWKPLLVQLIVTFITSFVFALLLKGFPAEWNVYGLGFFFWLGFIFPTQVAAVIFGGTKPEWVIAKIAIMAGAALGCMEIAAAVFARMM